MRTPRQAAVVVMALGATTAVCLFLAIYQGPTACSDAAGDEGTHVPRQAAVLVVSICAEIMGCIWGKFAGRLGLAANPYFGPGIYWN